VYHYDNDDHGLETETLSDTTPLDYNNDTTNYNTTNTLWYYAIEVMLRDWSDTTPLDYNYNTTNYNTTNTEWYYTMLRDTPGNRRTDGCATHGVWTKKKRIVAWYKYTF